ncbi:MAG: sulfite reductase (NADPH) flavoprotein alpha-component [Verrucomicrobia bacterium]|nr:MAG: sulfite reductase (NADPH) flavoprotein alpha-component [Verrucomicrobiota bacterium]
MNTESLPENGHARVVVMFGSQSGTAEELAKNFGRKLAALGYEAPVVDMAKFREVDLTREKYLLAVSSTWGEGEPPDNAVDFWNHLESAEAPRLENLSFSVLGLGDTDYKIFCGMGKNLDRRFEELGARRFAPRTDCPLEFEEPAQAWWSSVTGALHQLAPVQVPGTVAAAGEKEEEEVPAGYSKKNPFPASLLVQKRLCGPGSPKDTRHLEFSLAGSGLSYEVGDSLGLVPRNDPALVEELLQCVGCSGEESVLTPENRETSLRAALIGSYSITGISRKFLKDFADRAKDFYLKHLLLPEMNKDFQAWCEGREIVDLFLAFPQVKYAAEELVAVLGKLNPRLYSISSSLKKHPDQVHLTVARVEYESRGRRRLGVASTFLADRLPDGDTAGVFVQAAKGFKPPTDPAVPMIMVGPGTGIAPFRAFLEEREAVGATGRNWLFFGNPHRALDYFYEDEFEAYHASGFLTRLDLAWSRDQGEKVYVQHLLARQGRDIWAWLEEGAHFYVCGDASKMAKDVDDALHELIATHGGMSTDDAANYVKQMKKDKRYQRDVY